MSLALAAANSESMFSTVLLSVTLLPTTPQVTPFGLRKSFCGSVMSRAVRPGTMVTPGSGSAAVTVLA